MSQLTHVRVQYTEKTNCTDHEIRLTGGPNILEGRLEVCIDGVWGKVAGKIEGMAKDVACSSLGFNETGKK